jgi:S-DNA-T family DNA segregation ATPase FtsK/SpoIIIE
MAKKKINNVSKNNKRLREGEENPYFITPDKKKKIIGILVMIFSLLLLLSVISYSRFDKANLAYKFTDFFKVFSQNPDFINKVESTHNLLGIFGAYISDFLINNTIGWFSLVFPIITFVWGFVIVRPKYVHSAIRLSNFLVFSGLILSSFFGVLRYSLKFFPDINELSGNVGLFIGTGSGRLFGGLGSIILFITLLLIAAVIYFDIHLSSFAKLGKIFFHEKKESDIKIEQTPGVTHLGKPAKSKTPKKKVSHNSKFITELLGDESDDKPTEKIITHEDEDGTRITIKKKGPDLVRLHEIEDEESKKGVNEDDEIPLPAVDVEKENELPDQWEEKIKYTKPPLTLLAEPTEDEIEVSEDELKQNAELLKAKLALFDIEIKDISVTPGPVVTLYEIVPAPGVKISRIVSLENDIALALAARGIRIIAPIPGKGAIGVEIPNAIASPVSAKTILMEASKTKYELPLAMGKTITGEIFIADLARMPHLLIAGATGAGKSVGINMMLASLLYSKHPSDVKFVIVDPKKIELSFYRKLTKHFLAVSPDIDEEVITNPQNALLVLKSLEIEMDLRYDKLAKVGVRSIVDYNNKISDPKRAPKNTETMKHYKLPYIVVVIDELADLMITAGKEVEEPIARIAQLARAVGIHLVVATQRPSVNVITGTIKANFPARIAYQTASRIDSRTILDSKGAEQLLGRGDMLFLPAGMPKPIRIQNAFISTDEVEDLTNFIYTQKGYSKRYLLPSIYAKKKSKDQNLLSDMDPMLIDAARVIINHQQGSVSLLQRKLKLGYGRAARIVDQLEELGVVGPPEGSKAREVLIETEEELQMLLRGLNADVE